MLFYLALVYTTKSPSMDGLFVCGGG